ncbi:N-acetylmuramoyl-L-alanine amidase [Methylobacter sp. S3L5C]|uniref:N-acetylmuramoyl-L-alanine amidase n=1 Tax=Methylobacter sp. S3L5C TaxID=2839024 RepID=UPI00206757CA|nr:N-acetylmuramoyl-L-alanine amidase [Methylobacter sp. S3L5C]UOA09493.1 N-acetylmuramoyl-L-alanine amidase [Methylobacter sp. S3L5C]
MINYWKILFFVGLQLLSVSSYAQQINVNSLRYTTSSKQNSMAFDVTASTEHRFFVMDNPSRLVIDIKNARLKHSLNQPSIAHPLFTRVRSGIKDGTDLRIVVDLKMPISTKKFSLSANNSNEHVLVIDLLNKDPIVATITGDEVTKLAASQSFQPKTVATKSIAGKLIAAVTANDIVIAIDPGHGGNDPGAHGPQGTEEKKVTFEIAKKLEALISKQSGMKAVMIRKGDYYVGLRDRMKIARAAKADLFISIHADAFQDAGVKGASVYTLSTTGASSEAARWLADTANAADLVGVSLSDKEDILASVLLDLSQTATQEASANVAKQVLKHFDTISQLHKLSVQKAGFLVLKSPDIPSILVETAFISNASEERNLLSNSYQSKVANAIFKGVLGYFRQSAPVDDRVAALDM